MGILNITPDSFSEGSGALPDPTTAVQQAVHMVEQGLHVLDVGGQSTRPGARLLSAEEEMGRVMPVLRYVVFCFRVFFFSRSLLSRGLVVVYLRRCGD